MPPGTVRHGRAVLLIVGLSAATFANTLPNDFHLDDIYRIAENPGIHTLTLRHFVDPTTMSTLPRITQYRPLLPLTLSLNYAIAGNSLVGYHVGGWLIHAGASVLAYFVLWELLALGRRRAAGGRAIAALDAPQVDAPELLRRDHGLSLTAALLFAVHPVSGILVNYLCARDQSLMQVFLLLSLFLYLRLRRTRFTLLGWAGVLLALLASLCGKTDGAVAPALVVALEVTVGGGRWRDGRTWWRALPFALAVVAFFLFVRYVVKFSDLEQVMSREAGLWTAYPLTQTRLHLTHYAANFFWPWPLRPDPDIELSRTLWEPGVLAGGAFILASLWAAWKTRVRAPAVAFSILAYWLLIAPTSSFLPFHHLAVDYRPYPGSPFFFLALCAGGAWAIGRLARPQTAPRLLRWAAWAGIGYAAVFSVVLNTTWRTEESFWGHALRHGGGALAHHNFARSQRDPVLRERHYREALRRAPNYILAHVNLCRTLVEVGRVAEGLSHCTQGVRIDPRIAQTRFWVAVTYAELKRFQEATGESEVAVQLEPKNAMYRHRAALDALAVENAARALGHLDALDALWPEYIDAVYLRARALQKLGRSAEAAAVYRRFLAKWPRHTEALQGLAAVTEGGK